jgi:hypothetical protein
MKRPLILIVVTAVAMTLGISSLYVLAQAPDPIIGTWELNVAKSTYNPGPPPKSEIRKFETVGDGWKYTGKGVRADGTTWAAEYIAHFDGKDYPVTGDANADTVSMKRIDRFTTVGTFKKAGKVTYRATRVISQDGKVWTNTIQGTDAQGKPYNNVMVHDRR